MQVWPYSLLILLIGAIQTFEEPVPAVTDPGVVTTRQAITPAGIQSIFDGRVYGVTFGESTDELWVLTSGLELRSLPWIIWSLPSSNQRPASDSGWARDVSQLTHLDWRRNHVLSRFGVGGDPGLQGIHYDSLNRKVLVAPAVRSEDGSRRVRLQAMDYASALTVADNLGRHISGSPAGATEVNSRGERFALVPLTYDNQLAVIDLEENRLVQKLATGIAPFGAVVDSTSSFAFVTNWGGRIPVEGDKTLTTGTKEGADNVVVDERGIASTGSVTRFDLTTGKPTHTISVGLHPTAIVLDESKGRVYVANGNEDTVSVIDAARGKLLQTISLQPFPREVRGIAPTALVVSAGGAKLYVACGGINAIAVVESESGQIEGLIPTAWYPNDLALSPDGQFLAVSTLLGIGSGWLEKQHQRYVHSYRGSVSVIPIPEKTQLASYTTAVSENNRIPIDHVAEPRPDQARPEPQAIPQRSGDPSFIEHVVYIIKENRTYDQVFGDLKKGNGDPSLVLFGQDVTPNHRRLADQFVLLDNFYATGGNSADGHQWVTQANETDYCLWPGYQGRSYPFDGSDPIAYSKGGFIWNSAQRMGKTVRVYGEFAGRMPQPPEQRKSLLERWEEGDDFTDDWNIVAPLKPLNSILAKNFPAYTNSIPDVVRAQIFLEDIKRWTREGTMPHLIIMLLPCDHTFGTRPGTSTPQAMVADNDLALGKIVEALTRTPFWQKMAIFVTEDDAQNGVDHVDGHRTVALAISPYSRRGWVDSTFYSQPSMLKTIELILGLPTLSLFDLIANDMRAGFVNDPDFAAYTAVTPVQSLFEMNPPLKELEGPARQAAIDSMKMRFDVPDAAPTERLNRILWHQIKGWNVRYPEVKKAVFAPLSIDIEDQDREGWSDQ